MPGSDLEASPGSAPSSRGGGSCSSSDLSSLSSSSSSPSSSSSSYSSDDDIEDTSEDEVESGDEGDEAREARGKLTGGPASQPPLDSNAPGDSGGEGTAAGKRVISEPARLCGQKAWDS